MPDRRVLHLPTPTGSDDFIKFVGNQLYVGSDG
jgi:hypothetical protein